MWSDDDNDNDSMMMMAMARCKETSGLRQRRESASEGFQAASREKRATGANSYRCSLEVIMSGPVLMIDSSGGVISSRRAAQALLQGTWIGIIESQTCFSRLPPAAIVLRWTAAKHCSGLVRCCGMLRPSEADTSLHRCDEPPPGPAVETTLRGVCNKVDYQ